MLSYLFGLSGVFGEVDGNNGEGFWLSLESISTSFSSAIATKVTGVVWMGVLLPSLGFFQPIRNGEGDDDMTCKE